ncbi:hypothetical protein RRV45_07655 [Bacillus sp. DTU_2020_1000418_1_SI_GHA_SEK_038]|uniref:hypothetical protein n=1 Tax=Bacillus sp. DTU_2020_1000418_1_SI_GHA_SEK_038 TaxID=3077585 RepID=UPI0028E5982B|nr:hypothetical protein [Bacillus sp. DTU_2020_1000418_1_SI_GHA_SEK_038]WNS76853.1 hypothetical protein RRV45_07655 [Bacillus sp. DTU_2020_1000418_1_SI_GHA_SEK_038]
MDRAIIIGTFKFLGFHFCRSLLEQGFEVIGIRFDHDEKDSYINDKRMEIERNANFYEESLSNWLSKGEINDQTFLIFDHYDILETNQKECFDGDHSIEEYIIKNKMVKNDSRMISLFSIQSFLQMNETEKRILQRMNNLRVFLPTIYGPWQPSPFLFQQYLLKTIDPDHQISLNEQEWIHDTLYIDDIVDPILNLAKSSLGESYILKSDITNHWKKCADYLSIPANVIEKNLCKNPADTWELNTKLVKSKTLFSKGIDTQKRHLKLLHEGRI